MSRSTKAIREAAKAFVNAGGAPNEIDYADFKHVFRFKVEETINQCTPQEVKVSPCITNLTQNDPRLDCNPGQVLNLPDFQFRLLTIKEYEALKAAKEELEEMKRDTHRIPNKRLKELLAYEQECMKVQSGDMVLITKELHREFTSAATRLKDYKNYYDNHTTIAPELLHSLYNDRDTLEQIRQVLDYESEA